MRIQAGFNLIELMIVVAIIGILSSIGYSSYTSYTMEARRGDATSRIMQIAQAQEKYFLDNNSYAADLADLDMGGWQSDGDYSVSIETSTDPYRIIATTKSTGAQAGDTACATMWLNNMNQRSPAACWD